VEDNDQPEPNEMIVEAMEALNSLQIFEGQPPEQAGNHKITRVLHHLSGERYRQKRLLQGRMA
jgi:hypothetical protein